MSLNQFNQFKIKTIHDIFIGDIDLSFTNASLYMVCAVIIISLFYYLALRKASLVPSRIQSLGEIIFEFAGNTLLSTSGEKARAFIPFIFTLFCFILTLNLFGMLPYGYTVTSQIMVNFALAAIIFFMVIIIGFFKHGLHFLKLFLPNGTPLFMAPMIILIELLSFLARPITLTLRLAGNMVAGHILIKIVASFVIMMGIWGILPIPFMVLLSGFEYFVAILQAYIFTILSCVYLNDAINLH